MKTIDLSDLKAGDKAWSTHYGEVLIYDVGFELVGVKTETGSLCYYINGKIYNNHTHPTLFHSEQEFREYWGLQRDIDAPLTKREQFAMAAMQGLLAGNINGRLDASCLEDIAIEISDALLNKLNEKP
jgi:hypothetical protein